jgi:hypothetical protein
MDMEFVVTDKNIQIKDSYKVSVTREMKDVLAYLREKYPDNSVLNNRKDSSLIREWKGHNFLYKLGIMRSHTKDVDLDVESKNVFYTIGYWFLALGFDIVSIF